MFKQKVSDVHNEKEPQNKNRIAEIRKRRRIRRIKAVFTVVLITSVFVAYVLGALNAPLEFLENTYSDIVISFEDGDGFPVYKEIQNMQSTSEIEGGVALLEDNELTIYSAKGNMLYSVAHNFVNPMMTTGKNNICIYSPGTTNIVVTSRTQTLTNKDYETPVLLAKMSNNNNLAIFTKSKLEIMDSKFNSIWSWQTSNIIPLAISFSNDNKNFAVATLNSQSGAANTNIFIFNLNSDEIKVQIIGEGLPIKMQYKQNKLHVIYDNYSAVYNTLTGEELARFNYDYPSVLSADIDEDGNVALLFGNANYPGLYSFAILDKDLNVVYSSSINHGANSVQIEDNNVFLIYDDKIEMYNLQGEFAGEQLTQNIPLSIVGAKELLFITQKAILPLDIVPHVVQ